MDSHVIGRRNFCPVHQAYGELCPKEMFWEPELRCHVNIPLHLKLWQEKLNRRYIEDSLPDSKQQ